MLLWLSCLAVLVCVYTNPGHLFQGQPTLDRSGPIPFVAAHYGPLYYGLCLPFSYGLLGVALLTLGRAALHGPQLLRARSKLLILARKCGHQTSARIATLVHHAKSAIQEPVAKRLP